MLNRTSRKQIDKLINKVGSDCLLKELEQNYHKRFTLANEYDENKLKFGSSILTSILLGLLCSIIPAAISVPLTIRYSTLWVLLPFICPIAFSAMFLSKSLKKFNKTNDLSLKKFHFYTLDCSNEEVKDYIINRTNEKFNKLKKDNKAKEMLLFSKLNKNTLTLTPKNEIIKTYKINETDTFVIKQVNSKNKNFNDNFYNDEQVF